MIRRPCLDERLTIVHEDERIAGLRRRAAPSGVACMSAPLMAGIQRSMAVYARFANSLSPVLRPGAVPVPCGERRPAGSGTPQMKPRSHGSS
jgi:hypothetical protein